MNKNFKLALAALALLAIVLPLGLIKTAERGRAATHAQGTVREFTLVAEPVRWQIQPGTVVDGWGYNGQIPGPTLRVTEGDLVRVHLVNHLPEPTTIHWHGIDVPSNMDGVPGLSQDAVGSGRRLYLRVRRHQIPARACTTRTSTPMPRFSSGCMAPSSLTPHTAEPQHFDHDYTYILTEKSLDFHARQSRWVTVTSCTRRGQRPRRSPCSRICF